MAATNDLLEQIYQTLSPEAQEALAAWLHERERVRCRIMSGSPKAAARRVKAIQDYIGKYHGSHERALPLLELLENEVPEVFWPSISNFYPLCDDTAGLVQYFVLRLLRKKHRRAPSYLYLSAQNRDFLKGLPEAVTCYRGCSVDTIGGVFGISWTTEKAVAEAFARGHRGIKVPNAVVAQAVVHKSAIFFPCLDRNESELVLDPRFLRRVKIKPFPYASERRQLCA